MNFSSLNLELQQLHEIMFKTTLHIKWYSLYVVNVVVQFYPWFKFYFPLFLGMVMYDNEFETKENKI